MKIFSAMALTLALATPAGAQQANDVPLLTDWDATAMSLALRESGNAVGRILEGDDDNMVIQVTNPSGLRYAVLGSGCSGVPKRCRAANLVATVGTGAWNSVQAMAVVDFSALTETPMDERTLALSRYVLFDGGITRANLIANIQTFEGLVGQAFAQLASVTTSPPVVTP